MIQRGATVILIAAGKIQETGLQNVWNLLHNDTSHPSYKVNNIVCEKTIRNNQRDIIHELKTGRRKKRHSCVSNPTVVIT